MELITMASLATALLLQDAEPSAMSEAERVARAYMSAYSQMDLEAMESYLAEDAEFEDRTATGPLAGEDGHHYETRAETMAMLQGFQAQYNPIELGFDWHTVFESNDRVIFSGHVNALYPTQDSNQNFRWRAEQVTVITVRDGSVVRHQDFANYAHPEQGLVPAD